MKWKLLRRGRNSYMLSQVIEWAKKKNVSISGSYSFRVRKTTEQNSTACTEAPKDNVGCLMELLEGKYTELFKISIFQDIIFSASPPGNHVQIYMTLESGKWD